jgi:hydrogenase expression/formation protein HypC
MRRLIVCLSVVARIDTLYENGEARVELGNVFKNVSLGLLGDEIEVGDWVLLHTGFAIAKIDEKRAKEIMAAYELIE